jgi:excisionase family DNA binding protein
LRAREIAERLGLSERTIRRLIADRTLPSVKIGGARLVAEADLKRALFPETTVEDSVRQESGAPEEIPETYAGVVKAQHR